MVLMPSTKNPEGYSIWIAPGEAWAKPESVTRGYGSIKPNPEWGWTDEWYQKQYFFWWQSHRRYTKNETLDKTVNNKISNEEHQTPINKKIKACGRLPSRPILILANLNPNLNRKKFYYPRVKVWVSLHIADIKWVCGWTNLVFGRWLEQVAGK